MVELSTSQALASLSDEIKQLVDQQIKTLTSAVGKSKRALSPIKSTTTTTSASNCQVPLVQSPPPSDTCASRQNATRADRCVVSTNRTSALTHSATVIGGLASNTSQTIPKDNKHTTTPPIPPTSDDDDDENDVYDIPATWTPEDDDVAIETERSEKISREYIREVEQKTSIAHCPISLSNINNNTTTTHHSIEQQQQQQQQQPEPSSDPSVESVYQLRALKGSKSIIEESSGSGPNSGIWSNSFNVNSLSADLIEETLNYFVNCRHRLNQITKTFDDSDAYILLLQEKEMDLELVARIGQDLLKQFNEVKESNESLREELQKVLDNNEELRQALQKCQEDNQQLRYELASKVTLLDTFMQEEEEQQDIRDASLSSRNQHSDGTAACDDFYSDYNQPLSLRYQHNSSRQANGSGASKEATLQERVSELLEELLAKDEQIFKQTLVQQERSFQLEVQLRESEHKVSELETENETLRDNQKELYEEIKTQNRNFSELLRIFAESQQESKMHHINNISFDSYTEPPPSFESHLNNVPGGGGTSSFFMDHHHHHQQQQQATTDTQRNHHHHHHHNPHTQATNSTQPPTATPTESTCSCLCESPLLVELAAASANQPLSSSSISSSHHKAVEDEDEEDEDEEDEDEHERIDLPVLEWSKRATHNPLFLSISASFVVVILIAAKRRG